MISGAIPHDEAKRLAALIDYQILDTPPEPNFDELTELVASVLDVPIAPVSLIDEKRQWFKSHHGLDATETPRDISFCGHAILDDEVLIVEDSHIDERFIDNPLVTGDPKVRFYAGMPLITLDGYKLGTLCGIDHKPRVLTDNQIRVLDIISRQVVDQLELRRSIATKDDLVRQLNLTLKNLELANQEIRDFVSVVEHDLRAPVLNVSGFADELLAGANDMKTLLEQSKGNVPSDLILAVEEIIEQDLIDSGEHIRASAAQMSERINAIKVISRHGRRELNPEPVDLNRLVAEVCKEHDMDMKRTAGEIAICELPRLDIEKLSVQIVVENLVVNAVKYRSPNRPPSIEISAREEHEGVVVTVKDNGRGIEAEDMSAIFVMFRRVGRQDTDGDGTGLALSRTIVNCLGGHLCCESKVGEGSSFHLFLPSSDANSSKVAAAE